MSKNFFTHYLPPILWAIVIFILSSIPGDDYPPQVFDFSYLAHLVEFFILSVLVLRALDTPRRVSTTNKKNIFITLIICALYALSDELHQIMIAERSMSGIDWLLDMVGAGTGVVLWKWIKEK